ncbi:MAG: peptidase thermolysin [Candidatus Sulfotelmatobacter sp.]|nr:peptidase thermolysin [Candidatus Sulfotelmatobacter sp.]
MKHHVCCIVPPHILRHLAENAQYRQSALRTLATTERLRGRREVLAHFAAAGLATGQERRTIYDAKNQTTLPGKLVRAEGDPDSADIAVNEAYKYAGNTYDFYMTAYQRNSVDDKGMRLDSTVHYDQQYDNAFWDGQQMVYGDGDATIFDRFTKCLDVIGHELTHGVTQYTAGLTYQGQSGALNESMSDVFGSLVKQMTLGQTADQADWLIGAGLLMPSAGAALRSMKAPGTAYDSQVLGKDPQPATMADYVNTTDDSGGVHINSGIPNHAFYLAATQIGGNAWERAGKIWYVTLTQRLTPTADFQAAADGTYSVAGELYGAGSPEQQAVQAGWEGVGITPKTGLLAGPVGVGPGRPRGDKPTGEPQPARRKAG